MRHTTHQIRPIGSSDLLPYSTEGNPTEKLTYYYFRYPSLANSSQHRRQERPRSDPAMRRRESGKLGVSGKDEDWTLFRRVSALRPRTSNNHIRFG
jgi:hypothetical protein